MTICVFDTETTSLEKPFCYNIGYTICEIGEKGYFNKDNATILVKKDFVVEQVWHNPMLFTTAYYADKRPLYVNRMRNRSVVMKKFGYITREMTRDFENYNVEIAFAFNSSFDERVFEFNCEWFKCINPFDNMPIMDIRGYAHEYIVGDRYKKFCEENGKFTESGNYSTTAEDFYNYLFDIDFKEEHTALADSLIELEILLYCLVENAEIDGNYKAKKSIPREIEREWKVTKGKEEIFKFTCKGVTVRKSKREISIR